MNAQKNDILTNLTPEKRAALIDALKNKALQGQTSTLSPRPRVDGTAPVSPSQQSLWVLEQMHGNGAYNELAAFHVDTPVDIDVLERALLTIMARHEVLRTTYISINGEVVQRIAPAAGVDLKVVDLGGLDGAAQDEEIARRVSAARHAPFALEQGPLFRLELLQRGSGSAMLLVAAHHIVLDGWSIGIFRNELTALYAAYAHGAQADLPVLRVQYADYAIWQREQGRRHEEQIAYWKRQLADLPPLLDLSVTMPRPTEPSHRGGRHYFDLSNQLSESIRQLARDEDASLFMVLLAGFQLLLHRYSQQRVIPIGSAIANRNHPDLEGLIGYFINTVVMRADFDQDMTVRDFVRKTREVALAAYEHQDVPFQAIVDALQPQRSASHHPLFQVAFNLQNTPKAADDSAVLRLRPAEMRDVAAKFDLILWLEDTANGLRGYWEYSADLFDDAILTRMTGHLLTVLAEMTATPASRLSEISPMTIEERWQVLRVWNDEKAKVPEPEGVLAQIETHAAESPTATAVVYGNERLSYGELNRQANVLARHLIAHGLAPGHLAALCIERSCDLIVAMLAVLKAGAAYIPLDPTYPRARNEQIVTDAQPVMLLTRRSGAAAALAWAAPVLHVDDVPPADGTNLKDIRIDLAAPAYVIYTSGTTGAPKGVVISCDQLAHSTAARRHVYAEQPDSFLLMSSPAFDSSAAGIFWTLTAGGALIIPATERLTDIAYLHGLIETYGITHTLTIPALHAELLRGADAAQLASLRVVVVAGDACHPALVRQHAAILPKAGLYNEYGPTECTVWSTVHRCDAADDDTIVPIGRPIPYYQAYVLDEQQRPVPAGVRGELYIGGKGVALGYLRRPDLNAQAFVQVEIEGLGPTRLYRTGDVARWRADGKLELHGRTDQQVKIRGFRIELGDIEAALLLHPSVAEALATVESDVGAEKRLVAFVTTRDNAVVPLAELDELLRAKLPAFAVPSALAVVPELVKLPNGKLDRSRPPAIATKAEMVAVLTPLERQIADIWKRLLKLANVGPDDDFFKIGGDSLLMIRVYNELRKTCDVSMPIVELFKHPTPRMLACKIGGAAAPAEQWTELELAIADIWKKILKIENVGRNDDFFKIGGDSLLMIRVYNQLRSVVQTNIPIIELFKQPTPAALARLLDPDTVSGEI